MSNQLNELVANIKYHAKSYYMGNPEIVDSEFDRLVETLRKLQPTHPLLRTVGWGYKPVSDTLELSSHMYSVEKFDVKIKDATELVIPDKYRIYTVKLDGASLLCYYSQGKLVKALTRGDGQTGLDITNKAKALVPTELNTKFTGCVRGELIMPRSVFDEKYSKDYKSARNLATGMLMRTNLSIDDLTSLRFVSYKATGSDESGMIFHSKQEVLQWLSDNNFEVVDRVKIYDSPTDEVLREVIKSYTTYDIDGLIVTDDRYVEQSDGTSIQKDEQAYKTQSDEVEVTVTKVDWTMSRTFRMKPRVFFNPVDLSGATVVKATGFNAKYIKDNKIGMGAIITVARSGEVIPDIQSVIKPAVVPNLPRRCPKCDSLLQWEGTELVCANEDCVSRDWSDVMRWIEVIAPVKGLGASTIARILTELNMTSVTKLYHHNPTLQEIQSIPSVGTNTAKLFLTMLEILHKPVGIPTFFLACNIPGVGTSGAEGLAEHIDLLFNDVIDDDTWSSMVMKLNCSNKSGRQAVINKILRIKTYADEIEFKIVEEPKVEEPTETKGIIAMTGKLSVSRKEFTEFANQHGWSVGNIAKARYLVTNKPESTSGKAKTARDMISKGKLINIISEDDFRELV